jgi:N-methylhydantoinase B/oxoprolinase/acetone carboxylase alpha subunit
MAIDQVTMQVINNYLMTTAREMGVAMMNTSYSPLFNEGLDFSCAIFDEKAEMIAQAEFCPAQLGAIVFIADWVVKEVGIENLYPGDVVIHNDPFRGGCHIPEFCVIKPTFHDGRIVAFLCCIGHMTEVGGMVPGGFAGDATEVFQEGIRLPPVKICEGGVDREDIWNIILSNVRTPKYAYGDVKAMIGSLYVGERRIIELIDKYGLETFSVAKEELKDYSERRMRQQIAAIPDGVYRYRGIVIDNDGVTNDPLELEVAVHVRGSDILFDYSGSARQARGPVNCTYGVTASATYNALLHLTSNDIPSNHGCYRPVAIRAPSGTIVNVEYPGASVGGNSETHPHIVMAIYAALRDVLPDRISAFDGGTSALLAMGGVQPRTGEIFANLTNEGCGWGGRAAKDGNNVLCIPNGNCAIAPIEVLETRYPILHHEFSLREDSGGPGKNRGGLGCVREIEVLADELRVSAFVERVETPPEGVFGGLPGMTASLLVKTAADRPYQPVPEAFGTVCQGKFSDIYMKRGDVVRLETSGGGGYGDPRERDVTRVIHDVEEGFVSPGKAEHVYGVRVRDGRAERV